MSAITQLSEEIVHATDPFRVTALGDRFQLGALDHSPAEPIVLAVCFAYVSQLSLDRLRIALSQTLDTFPHLSGRLTSDSSGDRFIERLGGGALLQSASCQSRLSDARDEAGRIDITKLPGSGMALTPSCDRAKHNGDPVLSIKMTTFAAESGTVLGVRLSHSVCDATGFFAIVAHLSKLYNEMNSSSTNPAQSHLPITRPYMPSGTNTKQTVPHYSVKEPDAQAGPTGKPRPIGRRFLHFDNEYLRAVKAAAAPVNDYTSTYRALTAHIWQTAHRAACLSQKSDDGHQQPDELYLTMAVNLRGRLPSLATDSVFNNVLPCSLPLSSDSLVRSDLRSINKEINAALRQDLFAEPAMMDSTIQWIHEQKTKSLIDFRWDAFVSTQWMCDTYTTSTLDGVRPDLVCLPTDPGMPDSFMIFLPPPTTRQRGSDGNETVVHGQGVMVLLCLEEQKWKIIDDLGMLDITNIGKQQE